MKNLELEGFGLVEMKQKEMVETDGGKNWFFKGVGNLLEAIYIAGKEFRDGWNSVDCDERKKNN
ncbi:hypothetical protein [Pedobacter alpinus]|uniref:Bacteriocin-type signal sequence n=1 Tax=Pedobacter alpinus TaxID=1590643 RepID=A0ABW5TPG7_9SPHI